MNRKAKPSLLSISLFLLMLQYHGLFGASIINQENGRQIVESVNASSSSAINGESSPDDSLPQNTTPLPPPTNRNGSRTPSETLEKVKTYVQNVVQELSQHNQKFILRLIRMTAREDLSQMPELMKDFEISLDRPIFLIAGGLKVRPPTEEPPTTTPIPTTTTTTTPLPPESSSLPPSSSSEAPVSSSSSTEISSSSSSTTTSGPEPPSSSSVAPEALIMLREGEEVEEYHIPQEPRITELSSSSPAPSHENPSLPEVADDTGIEVTTPLVMKEEVVESAEVVEEDLRKDQGNIETERKRRKRRSPYVNSLGRMARTEDPFEDEIQELAIRTNNNNENAKNEEEVEGKTEIPQEGETTTERLIISEEQEEESRKEKEETSSLESPTTPYPFEEPLNQNVTEERVIPAIIIDSLPENKEEREEVDDPLVSNADVPEPEPENINEEDPSHPNLEETRDVHEFEKFAAKEEEIVLLTSSGEQEFLEGGEDCNCDGEEFPLASEIEPLPIEVVAVPPPVADEVPLIPQPSSGGILPSSPLGQFVFTEKTMESSQPNTQFQKIVVHKFSSGGGDMANKLPDMQMPSMEDMMNSNPLFQNMMMNKPLMSPPPLPKLPSLLPNLNSMMMPPPPQPPLMNQIPNMPNMNSPGLFSTSTFIKEESLPSNPNTQVSFTSFSSSSSSGIKDGNNNLQLGLPHDFAHFMRNAPPLWKNLNEPHPIPLVIVPLNPQKTRGAPPEPPSPEVLRELISMHFGRRH